MTDDERLARFVLFGRWIRTVDQTVKQDAFIPHPYPDLSVTRHKNLSERELWQIGQVVADARPATLHGRADVTATEVRRHELEVESRPEQGNPSHASIVGWPADKPTQKIIAQQLAAGRRFIPLPPESG